LLIGMMRGNALLKILLADAFAGLSTKDGASVAQLGLVLPVLRGAERGAAPRLQSGEPQFRYVDRDEIWLFMPLSFLFTFAHMPMLMKHGLGQRKVQKKRRCEGHPSRSHYCLPWRYGFGVLCRARR
jgi:intracellular septation protein